MVKLDGGPDRIYPSGSATDLNHPTLHTMFAWFVFFSSRKKTRNGLTRYPIYHPESKELPSTRESLIENRKVDKEALSADLLVVKELEKRNRR